MRAAVLHAYGETPVVEAFADPAASDGQSVVDVLAAGLNPIDLRIASGHTNFASPPERRAAALRRMWTHAAAGELHVDCEIVALDAIADAWRRQAEGPGRKLVIVPAIG